MRIAVLGSGPIGLEAAVHVEEAGHQVVVYEAAAQPAASVAAWGYVTLFTPWHMNTTVVSRARIGDGALLRGESFPTGEQYREQYLLPLAETLDLRTEHRVVAVGRHTLRKGDQPGSRKRLAEPFRLLLETPAGEVFAEADVVLDCTGTFADPAPAGPGGMPVPGEAAAAAAGLLRYGPADASDLAGHRVALIGDGASACTVLQQLVDGDAEVTWLTPRAEVPGFASPEDDPLPGRRALWAATRSAARQVDHRSGAWVASFEQAGHLLSIVLEDGARIEVDAAIAATGFRPDNRHLRELQFHACWGSEGPMKLAVDLLATRGGSGGDCLAAEAGGGPELLRSPEPRLFLLGSKSFGRRSDFLLQIGHQQILDLLHLLAQDD